MTNQAIILSKSTYTPGLECRSKRRELVRKIIAQLDDIQNNEEVCIANIPENLQESDAFVNAEHSAAFLMDAIESLQYAY